MNYDSKQNYYVTFDKRFTHEKPTSNNKIPERIGDDETKKYDASNYKDFITDTFKSITEPEQPRLTIIFQWNPEQEYQTNDFTDNLLDACNYKVLCTIQGKSRELDVKSNQL